MRKALLAACCLGFLIIVGTLLLRRTPKTHYPVQSSSPVAISHGTNSALRQSFAGGSAQDSNQVIALQPGSGVGPLHGAVAPASIANAKPPESIFPEITEVAPAIVMENLRTAFRQFSTRFGSNPTGTNPEITKALTGSNPKQMTFLDPEDGLRVNGKGELIDNWGTAFFFHQLSGKEMEIHSAGPDRNMWTEDDLVVK
jgi:hypothetical protein